MAASLTTQMTRSTASNSTSKLAQLIQRFRVWNEMRQTRNLLVTLPDEILRDIGLTRAEASQFGR